jgi:hypothetical protein
MANPRLDSSWNFHSSKTGVGCLKAQMQFPPPHIHRGWKFIFAHPTGVEIGCGEPVEKGGNKRQNNPSISPSDPSPTNPTDQVAQPRVSGVGR